jgi:hypothetical protein
MTRWPRYFHGLNIAKVAPLAYAANPITKPTLVLLRESFDRVIKRAHQSVCEDKISVFDQAQMNSFISKIYAHIHRGLDGSGSQSVASQHTPPA